MKNIHLFLNCRRQYIMHNQILMSEKINIEI
jgi:hypothetical protein